MKNTQHDVFIYLGVNSKDKSVKQLAQWITEKGWKITEGKKGKSLLNELGAHPFSIAILPYDATDCSSIKHTYEIKAKYPDISVLYFSSDEIPYEHLVYGMNEGSDGFLVGSLDKTQTMALLERKAGSHNSYARLVHRAHSLERQLHDIERENATIKGSLAELDQKLNTLTFVMSDVLTNSELYLGHKKIILVSDSSYQKNVISNFLREKNIQPVPAGSRKEAIEIAKTISPVIVISDYELEDGTGKELAHDLKNDPDIKNPYIIICSAAQSIRDEIISPASPVDDFLCKGSLDDLVTSIFIAYYTIKERSANCSA